MAQRYPFLVVIAFNLYACGEGTNLGGGYYLQDNNADYVYIHKKSGDGMFLVVDAQVTGYAVHGPFILVHRAVADSYECLDDTGGLTIITHRTEDDEYWILNSESGEKGGPYSDRDFNLWSKNAGLGDMEFHQIVRYKSNSSWFNSQASKCKGLEKISF